MIFREKFKTYGNVFDSHTIRNLFKLSSQGYFEEMQSPVKVGKESNVFTAVKKDGVKVIVKIYRLQTSNFNRMYDYIKADPRFMVKKNKRKIIFAWTQREFRNLLKAREANVKVPTPYTFLDNIIVMEFIGNEKPAPQLKDAHPKNIRSFFNKTIKNMKNLCMAGLVHADLSEYNILNFEDNPVFIDFSQCTVLNNPNADEYLERDARNICRFFRKLKMKCDEAEIIKAVKEQ